MWSDVSLLHRVTPSANLPSVDGWEVRVARCVPSAACARLIWEDDSSSLSVLTDQDASKEPVFAVRFDGVAQFTVSFVSHEILISPVDDIPDNTIHHLLVDQIWPRILAHRGELVLHASGVAGPTGALMFVGESGRGKSTLAASLHQRGFALLGDDAMVTSAVDGQARCRSVYRSLRLFPDSIAFLFDASIGRSDVSDYTDKENIHLPAAEQRGDAVPLQAIFFIAPDDDQAGPRVQGIAPGEACMRLVEHSFWLDPTDKALTARKLASASAVANSVPVYQLAYPRDYAKLGELHAKIFSVLD